MRPEPPAAGSVGALLTGFALKATFAWARGSIEAERISGRSIQRQVLNLRTWIPRSKAILLQRQLSRSSPRLGSRGLFVRRRGRQDGT